MEDEYKETNMSILWIILVFLTVMGLWIKPVKAENRQLITLSTTPDSKISKPVYNYSIDELKAIGKGYSVDQRLRLIPLHTINRIRSLKK